MPESEPDPTQVLLRTQIISAHTRPVLTAMKDPRGQHHSNSCCYPSFLNKVILDIKYFFALSWITEEPYLICSLLCLFSKAQHLSILKGTVYMNFSLVLLPNILGDYSTFTVCQCTAVLLFVMCCVVLFPSDYIYRQFCERQNIQLQL